MVHLFYSDNEIITVCGRLAIYTLIGWFKSSCLYTSLSVSVPTGTVILHIFSLLSIGSYNYSYYLYINTSSAQLVLNDGLYTQ